MNIGIILVAFNSYFKGYTMIIQTQYNYEKVWNDTSREEILEIISQEIGDVDAEGTLEYIEHVCGEGRIISVGDCKFREKK